MEFLIATHNLKKREELRRILAPLGIEVYLDYEKGVFLNEVEETGKTFAENAELKAKAACEKTGYPAIADDSGLVVDCLDGAPGVYSARFAGFDGLWPKEGEEGIDTDDGDNNAKLIRLIRDVPYEKRTARFVSVITMVYPDGRTIVARGTVEGHLVLEAQGGGGFGYDPLFVPDGYDKTFGELGPEVKNTISHRARALEELHTKLENSIE